MARVRRIGVMTGGGDAPGLNAVIRSVVKASWNHGIGCLGLEDSFNGLIEDNRTRLLTPADVRAMRTQVAADLDAAVAFAEASPFPDPKDLLADMFAE